MNLGEISRVDPDGMYEAIRTFPDQWRVGRQHALEADLRGLRIAGPQPLVLVGMGGSAIGGDLVRSLALGEAPVPVFVSRSYRLPAWVGPGTVVVVSSYSGNTEETLAAMQEAVQREATIVCLTSGGQVRDLAQTAGLPLLQIPGGLPPRAALGYSLTALLTLAERLGLVHLGEESWSETQQLLDVQTAALSDVAGNEALDLATALQGLIPVVYSSEGMLEAVNLRWRNQFHENSKTLATGNVFPELNHNEIMGWEGGVGRTGRIGVVVLRDKADHPQVARRIDITRGLLDERAGCWTEVWSRGASTLCRMLSLVNLGDWVSFYLAVLNDVDPIPIGLIARLKEALQEG